MVGRSEKLPFAVQNQLHQVYPVGAFQYVSLSYNTALIAASFWAKNELIVPIKTLLWDAFRVKTWC